jgi:hypothetical protein
MSNQHGGAQNTASLLRCSSNSLTSKYGKPILVRGRRSSRLTVGGEVVSLTPCNHSKIPELVSRLSLPQGHSEAGRIASTEEFNYLT